jgi:hypothetical protein
MMLSQVRAVERILLRCEEGLFPTQQETNILFEVQNLSSWIIKFRQNGTIINNWYVVCWFCVIVDDKLLDAFL